MATTVRVFGIDRSGSKRSIRICLEHWARWEEGGAPTISPDLMSEREIDACIDHLKADLDALAKKAKRALRAAKER
jgi:hypothetical protein